MKEKGNTGTYLYIRNYVDYKILQCCLGSAIWIEKIAECLVRGEVWNVKAFWQWGFVRKVPVNNTRWNRDNVKNNIKELYQVDGKETGSGLPQMMDCSLLRLKISYIVEECKTILMSLPILFHFLCAQHVSCFMLST